MTSDYSGTSLQVVSAPADDHTTVFNASGAFSNVTISGGSGRHLVAAAHGRVMICCSPTYPPRDRTADADYCDTVRVSEDVLRIVSQALGAMLSNPTWSEGVVRPDGFKRIKLSFTFDAVAYIMCKVHFCPDASYEDFGINVTPGCLEQVFVFADMYKINLDSLRMVDVLESECMKLLENLIIPDDDDVGVCLQKMLESGLVKVAYIWMTIAVLKEDDHLVNKLLPVIVLASDCVNARGFLGSSAAGRFLSDLVPLPVARHIAEQRSDLLTKIYNLFQSELDRIFDFSLNDRCSCTQHNPNNRKVPIDTHNCASKSHYHCVNENTARLTRIKGHGNFDTLESLIAKLSVGELYEIITKIADDEPSGRQPMHAGWDGECHAVLRVKTEADNILSAFMDDEEERSLQCFAPSKLLCKAMEM